MFRVLLHESVIRLDHHSLTVVQMESHNAEHYHLKPLYNCINAYKPRIIPLYARYHVF